ncbi:MAG: restriction endonuclease subunit S [Staphylococcus equorum]|nr:restriction endonuclease subunit S [Staphylococcus equorum]
MKPELSFPEFNREWDYNLFSEIVTNKSKRFDPKNEESLKDIELDSIEQNTGRLLNTYMSKDFTSQKNKFDKGSVLYSKLRPYLNKYYYAKIDGVCSSEIWVLNSLYSQKLSNLFLYYFIQTNRFSNVANKSAGSKMPRADWSLVENIRLYKGSIEEQRKIGDFFSKLDRQIELEEQKLEKLEEQKKGYMQQIFSQELRFKDENGNEYPKWEEGTIKSLVHGNISDGNWIEKEHISKTGKYRIIQTGNIGIGKYLNKENNSKFINQKDYDELKANEIYSGDILISRLAAPAGRSMIMPDINWRMVTSVDVAIIRPNKLFDPYFLMSMLNTDKKLYDISKFVSGSSHKRISRKNLEKIKLISPEIREQQKIGDFFRKIDELIEKQNQKIDGLKERKKGFLQKMFV